MSRPWRLGALCALGLGAAACSGVFTEPLYYYHNFEITPPRQDVISVCHGYSCRMQTPYTVTEEDWKRIGAHMARGERDPAAEREAVASVVTYMEHRVGAAVGTEGDRGRIELGGANDPTQQDCIDEASNTTSVLLVLQDKGLLKHHRVRKPEMRGMYIDGRWPHWTAVLVENEGGEAWAIDSWFRDNGEPPVVIALKDWYSYSERDGVREGV